MSAPEPVRPDSPNLELDCRDLRCPLPIIELARHLGEVAVGETLAVVARDPAALIDVPAWARMKDQEYLGDDLTGDGVARFWVRRRS